MKFNEKNEFYLNISAQKFIYFVLSIHILLPISLVSRNTTVTRYEFLKLITKITIFCTKHKLLVHWKKQPLSLFLYNINEEATKEPVFREQLISNTTKGKLYRGLWQKQFWYLVVYWL